MHVCRLNGKFYLKTTDSFPYGLADYHCGGVPARVIGGYLALAAVSAAILVMVAYGVVAAVRRVRRSAQAEEDTAGLIAE